MSNTIPSSISRQVLDINLKTTELNAYYEALTFELNETRKENAELKKKLEKFEKK